MRTRLAVNSGNATGNDYIEPGSVWTGYPVAGNEKVRTWHGVTDTGVVPYWINYGLGNLYTPAEAEAQALWDAQQAEHPEDYQYERYKINTRVGIGQWKDMWVTMVLAEDPTAHGQAFWAFINELRRHAPPIRSNFSINIAVPFRVIG